MIEELLSIIAGCALGTITGLIPGLHTNTVSFFMLEFVSGQNQNLALMIVAMTMVHSFVDFIPSIFLGAPDDETFLSVLPGHHFLLSGKAFYAVKLAVSGALISAIICVISYPLFAAFVTKLGEQIKLAIPWVLIASASLLVATEKEKTTAIIAVTASAALGFATLNNPLVPNPLFPLVSGFFAAPTLIFSLQKNNIAPKQKEKQPKINTAKTLKPTVAAVIAGAIVSMMPSLGGAQAAFTVKQFFQKITRSQYMVLLGGTSIANAVFSFFFLFLTQKTRTGSAAAIKELLELDAHGFFLVTSTAMIACGAGAIITLLIAKKAVKKIQAINYGKLNKAVLFFISASSLALSGVFGLAVFASAASTGVFCMAFGVKRTACMSFLMAPTILFYLGLGA